jgi:cell division protein ZapA
MANVSLSVNGRRYNLGCDNGEEERLERLGQRLDARVQALANQFGQIGDQRLLLMASITLMDEYDELAGNMEARADALVSEIQADAAQSISDAEKAQKSALKTLNKLADKVEKVLGRLPE